MSSGVTWHRFMNLTRRLPRHGIGCTVIKKGDPKGIAWRIHRVKPSVDGVYGQAFGERRRSQGGSFSADDTSNEPVDASSVKEIRGLSKSQWALVGGLPAESRALIREPVPWKRSTERQDALAALAVDQQQTPPPDG